MKRKKIGFIGAGNMGEALVRGLLGARLVPAGDLVVCDASGSRLQHMKKTYRCRVLAGSLELARECDIIFLAVKPGQIDAVLGEIGPSLDRSKLLVSVAAGVSLARIEARLEAPVRLARAMPNTPALVGEGAAALCFGRLATAADRKFALGAFGAVGRAVEVDETLMDAVTGLSGSGPAYVFSLIQGMADGGVRAGLPRPLALELAAQTVLGAARMVLETGLHPLQLRDQVASPGGTTVEGIAVLEEKGFQGALMEAVQRASEKSRRLSEK